eukprot:sb/3477227/
MRRYIYYSFLRVLKLTRFLKYLVERWNALQSPLLHCRATPPKGPVAYANLGSVKISNLPSGCLVSAGKRFLYFFPARVDAEGIHLDAFLLCKNLQKGIAGLGFENDILVY